MSSKNTNKLNIPEARQGMNKFKMEAATDFGVKRHIEILNPFYFNACGKRQICDLGVKRHIKFIQPTVT